jgi:alkylhydroperoxidase/carboxymuconolactone decarboxylase family protein YurZ
MVGSGMRGGGSVTDELCLSDLTWKSTFSRFEFQSYVRKRLTKGTRLNGDFVGEKGLAYTTRELMAYAFLVAKRRAESVEGIVKNVKDLF